MNYNYRYLIMFSLLVILIQLFNFYILGINFKLYCIFFLILAIPGFIFYDNHKM